MYSYLNKQNNFVNISINDLKKSAISCKNIINLSIMLNTSVEITKCLLKKLKEDDSSFDYKFEQYSKWTSEEDIQLEQEFRNNLSIRQISNLHGRTPGSIRARLKHKKIFSQSNKKKVLEKSQNIKTSNVQKKEKVTVKNLKKKSGIFIIKYLDEDKNEMFFFNITEKDDNITESAPLLNELFNTNVGDINKKFNFLMINKIEYHPKNYVEKCNNFVSKRMLRNIEIHHLSEYVPKWCNVNDINSKKILDLKNKSSFAINYYFQLTCNWLKENNLLNKSTIICVVPSHEASIKNESGISMVARRLIYYYSLDGYVDLVIRKNTIRKKSTSYFKPTLNQDIQSLAYNGNLDLSDKVVVILDDVTTHGDSFRAVAYHLLLNGAKKIIPLAMGKTVIKDE